MNQHSTENCSYSCDRPSRMISHLEYHSNQMGKEKIEGISNQLREYDRKRGTLETVKCIFCDFCGADKGTDHSHMMPPILMDFITPSLITVTQFPRRHIHVQDFCHSLPLHLHCILHTQYCLSAESGTFCPLLPYCGHHM